MSRKTLKIKGILDNSLIKAIGDIYRPIGGGDWKITIQLDPIQDKQSLGISQLPLLARRRKINATEQPKKAGYELRFQLESVNWNPVKIKTCPLPGVGQQEDQEQWCFKFQQDGIDIYLPQLELARTLFLHEPYLCRLAMTPNGLEEEFDVQSLDEPESIQINLLPACTLPKHVRGNHELRRALASVILDAEMRESFESISRYQIQQGEDTDQYRVWQFRFDPPALDGVKIRVRGHFDREISAIFVYEIYALENLPSNHAHHVNFFDPEYQQNSGSRGKAIPVLPASSLGLEIDDDEVPEVSKGKEQIFESPQLVRSYIEPAHTTRLGKNTQKQSVSSKPSNLEQEVEFEITGVSTDEQSRGGQLASAGIDGIDDQSDDAHNYASRFNSFATMVKSLEIKGCKTLYFGIRKLPEIIGRSRYYLIDGSPRCWSIYLFAFNGQQFVLMEVDSFDNRNQLSTLLLKQPYTQFQWEKVFFEIEKRVVHNYLKWPTKYLNTILPSSAVQRISHPQTSSEDKSFLETSSIEHWANRIFSKIQ